MSITLTIDGVNYEYPSGASDTNWAAKQVAAMQALTTAVNAAVVNPTWTALTPINSWANMASLAPAKYWVAANGQVFLRFALDTGTDATVAFVLPAAARPPFLVTTTACGVGIDDFVRVNIATNGNVTLSGRSGYDAGDGTSLEFSFSTVA